MQQSTLPSAWDYLSSAHHDNSKIRFVRPKLGVDLTEFHADDAGGPQVSKVLAVRSITLQLNTATPFHRHQLKEKIYIMDTEGWVELVLHDGLEFKKFVMVGKGEHLVVPPGWAHMLICKGIDTRMKQCELLVIASSQDSTDIEWEPNAEAHLKNEHLPVGKA